MSPLRPPPRAIRRRGLLLANAPDHDAVLQHVVVVVAPLAGGARGRAALECPSFVRALVIEHKALGRARRTIPVGWIARRTRHPRRAAPALVLAVPREIVVRLAHPTSVATAGALDCTPQDRPLSHQSAAQSAADAFPRGS